jgi:hypothetical protein
MLFQLLHIDTSKGGLTEHLQVGSSQTPPLCCHISAATDEAETH